MKTPTPPSRPPRGRQDQMLLAFMLGLLLFVSPLFEWWIGKSPPWYVAYGFWALLILAMALSQLGTQRDD